MGIVYLVGAGPGAPDLLTVRAVRLLGEADIVFHDALIGPEVLSLAPRAEKVAVGKRCGRHSTAQQFINKRLVDAACRHKVVVRLKGGDPMLFGRAHEEIAWLQQHSIRVEVVPGVTAALAAGALLGAPLGDDFAALSLSDLQVAWEVVERRLTAVAAAGLALALYNPRSRARTWQLERVLEVLREHRADDTALAVVTDAARAGQRVEHATLATLDPEAVTMRSLLVVAGDSGRLAGPWLVAERGAGVPA